jgi:hypothetical protein
MTTKENMASTKEQVKSKRKIKLYTMWNKNMGVVGQNMTAKKTKLGQNE